VATSAIEPDMSDGLVSFDAPAVLLTAPLDGDFWDAVSEKLHSTEKKTTLWVDSFSNLNCMNFIRGAHIECTTS
jgi:hypothetical protein